MSVFSGHKSIDTDGILNTDLFEKNPVILGSYDFSLKPIGSAFNVVSTKNTIEFDYEILIDPIKIKKTDIGWVKGNNDLVCIYFITDN